MRVETIAVSSAAAYTGGCLQGMGPCELEPRV